MEVDMKRILKDDQIFNAMNKLFLSLDPDDVRNNNQDLQKIFDKLIEAMKKESPLFRKTFQRIIWAGSYYKGTRVGKPKEYDINFVINLPIKEKGKEKVLKCISDLYCPGYIKIRTNLSYAQEFQADREMKSFIDEDLYLNQEKIRSWMEGILSKVACTTSGNNQHIKLDGFEQITKSKSGPAFTLNVRFSNGNIVDIDLVPVLAFSIDNLPPKCLPKLFDFYDNPQELNNKYWSAVPKPLNNNKGRFPDALHRYWRLCFYDYEKDILSKYGRAKPVIRHLKKLRDTEDWKNIASYYIETLCLHQLHLFCDSNSRVSSTYLFFMMLEKLRDAFHNCYIKHYWEDFNLLENMKPAEMNNIENRLNKIIEKIKKSISNDKFAIANYVLTKDEFEKLVRVINQSDVESNPIPDQTEASEECIII